MLERSFGLMFYLKPARNEKDGNRFIYLRITVEGKYCELSTKRKWPVDKWNVHAGRASGNKEDAKVLNAYLDLLTVKVFQAKKKLIDGDKEMTADAIKAVLQGTDEVKRMLLEVFLTHNKQMEDLIGIDYAPATAKRYKTSLEHTRAYIRFKYGKEDVELRDLNFEFISDYHYWLKSVRNCNHNTTVKYLLNFKKIVLNCVSKGWLPRDPFTGFKLAKKEVSRVSLTKEELQRLSDKTFDIDRIAQVRDIFLFSCYTGLAYIDVKKLSRKDIVTGIDGEQWIVIARQKTGTPTRLPLLPKAVEIMEKYKDHPKCVANGALLPVLSNQKMNSYVKEIADLCGIDKVLTFHIARHTFATTVTLSNGVPIETVSKILGHKSIKQTQHYAKILDIKISSDMGDLKRKLSANQGI